MSLVISLTCALLATLLQQWARRYIKVTQPRYSLHKRARIRSFFAEGVEKSLLPWVVDALPTLLHISLSLFFAGLGVFLCNVNLTIFRLVVSWVGGCTALYGWITVMPVFRHDSPYRTPLLLVAWEIASRISFPAFRLLCWFWKGSYGSEPWTFLYYEDDYPNLVIYDNQKTAELFARKAPSEIDTRAFFWTFHSLDEDHELERFFSGLPGFRNSQVVKDPMPSLNREQQDRITEALVGLVERTFLSELLPDYDKKRRALICAKAMDPNYTPKAVIIFDRILFHYRQSCLISEIVRIVKSWVKQDVHLAPYAEATVSRILVTTPQRDDYWFVVASNELGVEESVLREYAADGHSLSLALLIHVTRQKSSHFLQQWPCAWDFLQTTSHFDTRKTSPKLQHSFCALWNEIVLAVQNENDSWRAHSILRPIRNIYIDLHQGTGSAPTRFSASTPDHDEIFSEPFSYPLCNVPGHHPDSTPHIHDGSASTPTVLHDNAALAFVSLAGPDASSSSVPAPTHVDESLTNVPPLDNNVSLPVSTQSAHETTVESRRISAVSQNPGATCATHAGLDTSARAMSLTSLETSASNPLSTLLASTSPPDAVVVQHIEDSHTSSGVLDVALPPSPTDSAGPQSSLDSPVKDLTPPFPRQYLFRRSRLPQLPAHLVHGRFPP